MNVTVATENCTGAPSPGSCSAVGSAATDASGVARFSVPNGTYFVYSNHTMRWGGDWTSLTIGGAAYSAALVVYPWVGYGNVTLHLPAWNNLSQYASNCNAKLPCVNGTYGGQVPVLAWTQDGVFYVNETLELVFYSFVNATVYPVARWTPLYDNIMSYDGIENTEWITADDSFVYEVGCWSACNTTSTVAVFAVNVTTGATFTHNFSGVTENDFKINGQVDLIGLDGNHSIVSLIEANGTIRAYDLWNGTQWKIGQFAFFEANNAYWVPTLNSYIDVEAQGSSFDRIFQYRLTGEGAGGALTAVFAGNYGKNYKVNGVDGLYLNLTTREIVVTESSATGNVSTQVFNWSRGGVLSGPVRNYGVVRMGQWPSARAPLTSISSEHRPAMSASTPLRLGFWNGFFDNRSWLYDLHSGTYLDTNLNPSPPQWSQLKYRQSQISPAAVEGLFFNTTYGILEQSVDCRTANGSCPILGTASGTTKGAVWWAYRLGAPLYPYPDTAGIAQTLPPATVASSATSLSNSVTVRWSPPISGQYPILNYTVFWGNSTANLTHALSAPDSTHVATISGLPPLTSVTFGVMAWNLHWHGALATGSATTTARPHLITNFTANPTTVDLNMPFTLRTWVNASFNSPSFAYSGLPPGCASANQSILVCVPTIDGYFTINVTVTNLLNETDIASVAVRVDPTLSPIRILVPIFVDANRTANYSVSISQSGTPPYTFRWIFDDGYLSTGPTISHAFATPGTHVVAASATDRLGEVTNGTAVVIVHTPLAAEIFVRPPTVLVGSPVVVSASAGSTGSPPILFHWNPSVTANNVASETLTFAAAGNHTVQVTITDAAGASVTLTVVVDVVPSPMVTLTSLSASTTDVGVAVVVLVQQVGGVLPIRVSFPSAPPGCTGGNSTLIICTPTVAGVYLVQSEVTDARGLTAYSSSTLTVNPRPGFHGFVTSPAAPIVGERLILTASVAGGTPPYRFAFWGLPPGCPPIVLGGPVDSCTPTRSGAFVMNMMATDAVGASVNASAPLGVSNASTVGNGSSGGSSGTLPWWSNGYGRLAIPAAGAAAVVIALWGGVRRFRRARH